MPPTVRCPGCAEAVEIEHQVHRTLDGRTLYVPIQSEHDALLNHMDRCPAVGMHDRGDET
jgi:hypothetical protein